jgi:hypothetical protein
MKPIFIYILLIFIILFEGCAKDSALKRSVFIEDPDAPGLPQYSEWGYNTFGVYYDRQIYRSNDNDVPAKIITENNGFVFVLEGSLTSKTYYYDDEMSNMKLLFSLNNYRPEYYKNLTELNNIEIDLTASNNWVLKIENNIVDTLKILSGILNFKRAQLLLVDDISTEAILSGYFNFNAIINGNAVTFSDGRFDVGIGYENFY